MILVNIKIVAQRHKKMCEYEVYIQAKQLQRSFNAFRNRYSKDNHSYKRVVFSNNMILSPNQETQ